MWAESEDEGFEILVSRRRYVVVGNDLKGRLDAIAEHEGADSDYVARRELRRFADEREAETRREGP